MSANRITWYTNSSKTNLVEAENGFSVIMFFHGFPLREKLRTRTSFSKLLANYTSEESLINAVYDKNIIQVSFNVIVCIKSKFQMSVKSIPRLLCFYSTSLCNWCTKLASFSRPIRFNARVFPRYRVEAIYHRYIKIPIWLRGGIKQKKSHRDRGMDY